MKKKLVLSLLLVLFISLYSCVDAKVKIEFELAKDEKVVGEMRNAKVNDSLAYVLENVTCEKEGYEFIGWSVDGETLIGVDTLIEKYSITVKPLFKKLELFTVTFKVEGEEDIIREYKKGDKIIAPSVTPQEGYEFVGWDKEIPSEMGEENLVFTAVFKKIEEKVYTVTFKVEGEEDIIRNYKKGEKIIAPSVTPQEGYEFVGWDKEIPSEMAEENLVFTAVFKKIEEKVYTVTFKVEGEEDIIREYKKGEKIIAPEVTSTDKMTFMGWDKEIPSEMVEENLVFTAIFKVNYYDINYVYEEGKWPITHLTNVSEVIDAMLTDFYEFLGSTTDLASFIKGSDGKYASGKWYDDRAKLYMANVKEIKTEPTCFINDVRYHDKWIGFFNALDECVNKINPAQDFWGSTYVGILRLCEVCDHATRFSDEMKQTLASAYDVEVEPVRTYKPGEEVVLLELSLADGREFLGWYMGDEKITKITSDMACDVTLVAKWSNPIFPSSIEIKNQPTTLDKGVTFNLEIVMSPNNITHPQLVMLSSEPKVAVIENGVIKTKGYGTTTITIYSEYVNHVRVEFTLSVFPTLPEDAPVIYFPFDVKEILVINASEEYDLLAGVKAYDKVDGDITTSIIVKDDKLDSETPGIYTITYEVMNSKGNKVTLDRTVKVIERSELIFIGHAGSYLGIMNTEEAFINGAKVKGYKALECDVKQTKDGVFVVCHDNDFAGVDLASTNYADLKDVVKTQTRGGITYSSTICTFERYLEICKEYNVYAVVELKSSAGITNSDQSRMPALMQIIKDKGMLDKVIFLGSQYKCLEWVRNNGYKYIPCQYLVNSCESETIFERCVTWNFDVSFNIGYNASIEWIERYHEAGLKVACYTFSQYSNAATLQSWIDKGVDYVTCDVLTEKDVKLPVHEDDDKPEYKVTFQTPDGVILKETVVKEGKKAIAPVNTDRNGYKFIGWDNDFSNITSNLVVTAQYELIEFEIVYDPNFVIVKEEAWVDKEAFVSEFYTDWFNWIVSNVGKISGITFDGTTYTVKMNNTEYGTATFKTVEEMRALNVYNVERTIGALVYKPIEGTNSIDYVMEEDNGYFLNTEPYRTKYKALNAYFLNVMNTAYTSYSKQYKQASNGRVQIFFRFHQWQKGTKIVAFDTIPNKTVTEKIDVEGLVLPTTKVTYTIEDSFVLENATCQGYKFLGWYLDQKCTKEISEVTAGTYGKILLYAKWEKIN